MPAGYDLLSVNRVNTMMRVISDELVPLNSLSFLAVTPTTPAVDEEIMGYYEAYVVSADIISDDSVAPIRQGGRFVLTTTAIPNLKQGSLIKQSMFNLIRRINSNAGLAADGNILRNYIRNEIASKLNAIRILQNRMIAGMHMDLFSYKKGGISYQNVTWGMHTNQKLTPSVAWTVANAATAMPVDDLLAFLRSNVEAFPYKTYDYIKLSRRLMHNIVVSDNFKNYMKLYTPVTNFTTAFPDNNFQAVIPIFEQATGLAVRLEDATFKDESQDGTRVTTRYQPVNIAILGNSQDDNNADVMDFANAIVNETEVGIVPGTQVIGGGFGTAQYGPVSYATIRGDLNPPNLTLWGAARGFPRKKDRFATARITAYPTPEATDQTDVMLSY